MGVKLSLPIQTVLGCPRPPLGLVLRQEDSQDSACSCTHRLFFFSLLQWKDQQKEKVRRAESRGNPLGSYRLYLIPVAMICDNMCETSTKEAL